MAGLLKITAAIATEIRTERGCDHSLCCAPVSPSPTLTEPITLTAFRRAHRAGCISSTAVPMAGACQRRSGAVNAHTAPTLLNSRLAAPDGSHPGGPAALGR